MGLRILIAEDEETSARLLSKILEPFGSCDLACTGQQAVTQFQEALTQGNPYDLICLDILMPELDGHDALAEIRKREEAHGVGEEQQAKIVMVSALDDHHNVLDAIRAGCQGYVSKPYAKSEVLQELELIGVIAKDS